MQRKTHISIFYNITTITILKKMAKIEELEGIGPAYGAKLKAAGIETIEALLEKGATPKGRKEIEEATGIAHKLVLTWVNMADLCRIKGVGPQFAELLEAAGVDTVKELRHRVPANLHAKLVEVNTAKNLTGNVPSEKQIAAFVEEAKTLEIVVSY